MASQKRKSQGSALLRQTMENRQLRQSVLVELVNAEFSRLMLPKRATAMELSHVIHERRTPSFPLAVALWRCVGVSPDSWLLTK